MFSLGFVLLYNCVVIYFHMNEFLNNNFCSMWDTMFVIFFMKSWLKNVRKCNCSWCHYHSVYCSEFTCNPMINWLESDLIKFNQRDEPLTNLQNPHTRNIWIIAQGICGLVLFNIKIIPLGRQFTDWCYEINTLFNQHYCVGVEL